METVNNLAAAASKAIWGEPATEKKEGEGEDTTTTADATTKKPLMDDEALKQEPLSGVQGDVAKGEPFDKGNEEPTTESVLESTKVLPLRPAGAAPAEDENISTPAFSTSTSAPHVASSTSTSTSTDTSATDKHLPSLPSAAADAKTEVEKLVKPTPFIASLKGDAESKDIGSGVGADTTAVKGASGERLDRGDLPGESRIPAASTGVQPGTSTSTPTAEAVAPVVPSKVSSEESVGTGSGEGKEGKEKLSLKEKIKAKLHKH